MRIGRGGIALLLACAAMIAGASLFRIWVYHEVVELGYALSNAETTRRQLTRRLEALEVELAAERSPERLATIAQERGMTAPEPHQIIGGRHASR